MSSVRDILSSFSCAKDNDIESFLKEKAINFENLSKSRTYLICDEQKFCDEHKFFINGYISLALKTLTIPDGISIRRRGELDGLSGKIHGSKIENIPCYLIGQLARNDASPKSSLSGKDLIERAQSIIMSSVNAVGGRYMMIECHNNPKLIQFYRDNGFEEISNVADDNIPMVQMLCKLVD